MQGGPIKGDTVRIMENQNEVAATIAAATIVSAETPTPVAPKTYDFLKYKKAFDKSANSGNPPNLNEEDLA